MLLGKFAKMTSISGRFARVTQSGKKLHKSGYPLDKGSRWPVTLWGTAGLHSRWEGGIFTPAKARTSERGGKKLLLQRQRTEERDRETERERKAERERLNIKVQAERR